MYLAAVGTARTYLSGGTSLKNEVRAATTIDEVNAIIDNR
jgi:outer membrane murein-binding lipoprotein Lpp